MQTKTDDDDDRWAVVQWQRHCRSDDYACRSRRVIWLVCAVNPTWSSPVATSRNR